jgi:hypothetical protein
MAVDGDLYRDRLGLSMRGVALNPSLKAQTIDSFGRRE